MRTWMNQVVKKREQMKISWQRFLEKFEGFDQRSFGLKSIWGRNRNSDSRFGCAQCSGPRLWIGHWAGESNPQLPLFRKSRNRGDEVTAAVYRGYVNDFQSLLRWEFQANFWWMVIQKMSGWRFAVGGMPGNR